MKTYWIFGCLIVGAAVGLDKAKCPNDAELKFGEMAALVAIWPSVITYGIFAPHHELVCEK